MISCPVCGESRWIYPRQHVLGWIVTPLTRWQPAKCKACGWRGWRRSLPGAGDRILVHFFTEYLTATIRRLPPLPRLALSPAAIWLIVLVTAAVAAAGVQFSASKPSRAPDVVVPVDGQRAPEPPPRVDALEPSRPDSLSAPLAPSLTDATMSVPPPTRAREGQESRPAAAPAPATTIAAPQYRGVLAISSEPAGAIVMVDGQVVGPTPLVVKEVRAGSRVVRIESSGYTTWSTAARVVANKETRVNAALQREPRP